MRITINLSLFILIFLSCQKEQESSQFKYIKSSESGLDFSNDIVEGDSINVVDFQYCYNGGGVGIGDFNNDDLPDVVFTGNQVSSKVFLNQGNLKFEDISTVSGFVEESWVTGVTIVDINSDGFDDIYLCVGGVDCKNDCPNLLFVNQGLNKKGIPVFSEQAKKYGLDDGNYAQQSVFFDYDSDGDLDVYIAHNGSSKVEKNTPIDKRYFPKHLNDFLLRNDVDENGQIKYVNISKEVGINHPGFGLGLGISDFNNDNIPDVYVSNDFISDDLMYLNQSQKKDTFIEASQDYLSHQTYNAMGCDITDINNDLRPDILVVDMLPVDYKRQKSMLGNMNYDRYLKTQEMDYASQFMHNTLQINNGDIDGEVIKFSEVGFLNNIGNTDWSWAPLMVDFDNDGHKDIFISNGYGKDVTNLDFMKFSDLNTTFGTAESKKKKLLEMLGGLQAVKLNNFFYKQDSTGFEDVSTHWASEKLSLSNGAAYADFDKDGDLDLVVNNINEEAFLLENKTNTSKEVNKEYLRIKLVGEKLNKQAIGTKVLLFQKSNKQYQYHSVTRGYLSSVEPILHFGLTENPIDSLKIIWSGGGVSTLYDVEKNQVLEVKYEKNDKKIEPVFVKRSLKKLEGRIDLVHKPTKFNEYNHQHLMMHQISHRSPVISSMESTSSNNEVVFIGGTRNNASSIWQINEKGVFEKIQELESKYDDTGAAFFDIDNDGDKDLYVCSGGNNFELNSEFYQDRLYLNDGTNQFKRTYEIPTNPTSSNKVTPFDYDKDGDVDLLITSNIVPKYYPKPASNYILENKNGVLVESNLNLKDGLVNDAIWQDLDGDGWHDLIVVGEWMSIEYYKNDKGTLTPTNLSFLNQANQNIDINGWWNCIKVFDFDNDGDLDFLVGNQGLNNYIKPRKNEPLYIYNQDFDKNGSLDPLLGMYYEGVNGKELYPVASRDDGVKQLSILQKRTQTYDEYSSISFQDLLKIKNLEEETLIAHTFASSYLENIGDGTFIVRELPKECQVAPIEDMLLDDIDNDGWMDVLLVGNDETAESTYGKQDAMTGMVLKNKKGRFVPISSNQSGFYVPNQSNSIVKLKTANEKLIMVSQYNGEVLVFKQSKM